MRALDWHVKGQRLGWNAYNCFDVVTWDGMLKVDWPVFCIYMTAEQFKSCFRYLLWKLSVTPVVFYSNLWVKAKGF